MKYSKLILLSLIFLLGTSILVQAGTTGKIAGVVADEATGEALPGANITVEGTDFGAATDLNGNYFIINLAPGRYDLQVSMMGYAKMNITDVLVRVDRTTEINIELVPETIEGQEVTVVATRPIIEKDLTASQQVIDAQALEQTWATNVVEAVAQQNGIISRGTFLSSRGGLFTDLNYMVDGSSMNSGMIGDNYTGINKSTIQEMRVLTGGFNAEYGSALSGVLDIVTKEGAGPISGRVDYRYRPAGVYHWGPYMYSRDLYDWTNFDLDYWTENDGGQPDLTPEQRLGMWQDFLSNADETMTGYDKRAEWETEATLSGSITPKLGFLVSGRWKEGVNVFPQARKYNPEWNGQAKISYRFNPSMKLTLNGIYGGYKTAGSARSFIFSSEASTYGVGNTDLNGRSTQILGPYDYNKYFPYTRFNAGMPMEMEMNSVALKWNHILSPSTFYEVKFSRFDEYVDGTADNSRFFAEYPTEESGWPNMRRNYVLGVKMFESLAGSPNEFARSWSEVYNLKTSITSQITNHHQIKAGLDLTKSDLKFKEQMTLYQSGPKHTTWQNHWDGQPFEGALYVQDKIEYSGMIINAGLRMDFFNALHDAPSYIWDTFSTGINSPGHDPNDPDGIFPGWEAIPTYKTPWRVAFSPRFGISHPITETTILHFTYGHFNKRPGWLKFYGNNYRYRDLNPVPVAHVSQVEKEPSHGLTGNGLLDFEKLVEYELGFDQEIAGLLRLDATLYYKEAKNLTTIQINTISDGAFTHEDDRSTGSRAVTSVYGITPPSRYPNVVPVNVGHQDVRGFELTLETAFSRMFQLSASYDLSYNIVGRVGWSDLYDPAANTPNNRFSLGDADQRWNPTDKFKVIGNVYLPEEFGPRLGPVFPIGDLNMNVYFEAWSGRLYTAHFPERGDLSTAPLNRRWEPHYRTNLSLTKGFNFTNLLRPVIGIEVRNLFNNKDLNRPGGANLERYLYEGELWDDSVTGEPDEWGWYDMFTNPPRQIYFTLALEF